MQLTCNRKFNIYSIYLAVFTFPGQVYIDVRQKFVWNNPAESDTNYDLPARRCQRQLIHHVFFG